MDVRDIEVADVRRHCGGRQSRTHGEDPLHVHVDDDPLHVHVGMEQTMDRGGQS